jgi:hypothetical protein
MYRTVEKEITKDQAGKRKRKGRNDDRREKDGRSEDKQNWTAKEKE